MMSGNQYDIIRHTSSYFYLKVLTIGYLKIYSFSSDQHLLPRPPPLDKFLKGAYLEKFKLNQKDT